MQISQITASKGRYIDVAKNLPHWLNSGVKQLIVVDYFCPDHTGKKLLDSKFGSDPRLIVIIVGPSTAGPFYNHSKARNIGVNAAQNEIFSFIDADVKTTEYYNKQLLTAFKSGADVVCGVPKTFSEHNENFSNNIPDTYRLDRQFAVLNAVFYDLNGFDESSGWYVETYDFLLRCRLREKTKIKWIEQTPWISHNPVHSSDNADSLLSIKLDNPRNVYVDSWKRAAYNRKLTLRAQPGQLFGLDGKGDGIHLYKNGIHRAFSPGDDL